MLLIKALKHKREFFVKKKISITGHTLWMSDYHSISESYFKIIGNNSPDKHLTLYYLENEDIGTINPNVCSSFMNVIMLSSDTGHDLFFKIIYKHLSESSGNEVIFIYPPLFFSMVLLKKLLLLGKQKKINIVIVKIVYYALDIHLYKNLLHPYIDFLLIFNIDDSFEFLYDFDLIGINARDLRQNMFSFFLLKCDDLSFRNYCHFPQKKFTF